MLNLRPHHRIQIPDFLAVLAVVLLLISSAAGIVTGQNTAASSQETALSANAETPINDSVNNATVRKPRGLNLGLLLFRR